MLLQKKHVKSKEEAKKWLWWYARAKNFYNDNPGEFVLPSPNFTMIQHQIHLKCHYYFFAFSLPSQPFPGLYFGFTSFFTTAILGATHYLQLGYFGLDFTSFCPCIL